MATQQTNVEDHVTRTCNSNNIRQKYQAESLPISQEETNLIIVTSANTSTASQTIIINQLQAQAKTLLLNAH